MDIASLSRELILHEPAIIINIEKSISSDLSKVQPSGICAAVSRLWTAMPEPNLADRSLVLARNSSVVVGVFRVKRWIKSPLHGNRWGMVIEEADVSTQIHYLGKNIPDKYGVEKVALCQPGD